MRRSLLAAAAVLPALLLAHTASAQRRLVVTGAVFDSLAGVPIAGALVQLVPDSNRTTQVYSAQSDSAGRYRIEGIAPGTYIAGFLAPAVDRLGLELRPRRVLLGAEGDDERMLNFAIPPAPRVIAALCPSRAVGDSAGVLLGHVYDADDHAPRAGAVTVLWYEINIGDRGLNQQRRQYPSKTDADGWYALCGLPAGSDLAATAVAGDEESGMIEVRIPAAGVLVQDFAVSRADSQLAVYADSSVPPAKRERIATLRRGAARLAGMVRDAKGNPVPNAEVSVPGTGLATRTSKEGSYALSALPSGTWTVDVRAIGFEPRRVPAELGAQRVATADVVLDTHVPSLDVVHVYGSRPGGLLAFERRRATGLGHILTATDIARRNAIRTTDALRFVPGIRVVPSGGGFSNLVRMRGGCRPKVYLNGMPLADDAADDLDSYANPSDITAIEVYNLVGPAEYPSNNCGAVLVWAGTTPR